MDKYTKVLFKIAKSEGYLYGSTLDDFALYLEKMSDKKERPSVHGYVWYKCVDDNVWDIWPILSLNERLSWFIFGVRMAEELEDKACVEAGASW